MAFLKQCQLNFLRLGHCTGEAVIARMQGEWPEIDVQLLQVGARVVIAAQPIVTTGAVSS